MNGTQSRLAQGREKLLQTKLAPPRLPRPLVEREHLFDRLDELFTKKLALVVAPTGFGKTTLVTSWLAARGIPAAWVTLDAQDNDPVRFWRYCIAALRRLDASLGKGTLSGLQAAQPVSLPASLAPLINELSEMQGPHLLVLEDFHTISSAEVQATLVFFIQNLPPALHMALISRGEPELPLGILRARGEMVELDAASLRFSESEAGEFLRANFPTELPTRAIQQLTERTEGWAAGLRLAAHSWQHLRETADLEEFAQTFSGGHRHIADYLLQEVFAGLAEAQQEFLLYTCLLGRLTPGLCAAVLPGQRDEQDAAALLDQLERENLFLVRLQEPGGPAWYRYHTLFAGSIRTLAIRRLGEAGIRAIYARASEWLEANCLSEEAIETALQAEIYPRALELIANYVEIHGLAEVYTLRRWLEQIPEEQISQAPEICFLYAQVLLYTSDRFAAATAARLEPLLQAAEAAWEPADPARAGRVHAFRGQIALWQGDFAKAFACAAQALREMPESEVMYRGTSLLISSFEALHTGRVLDAQDKALEARALLGAALNIHGVLAALHLLSEAFYWQGEIERSAQLHRQVLNEAVETAGESMLDDQGYAALGLADVAYERNELAEAESWGTRAVELAAQRGNTMLELQASLRLADVRAAQGELRAARELLQALAPRIQNPAWLREIRLAEAWLALRANEREPLEEWAAASNLAEPAVQVENALPMQQEREAFMLARVQIQSGHPAAALRGLEGRQQEAARMGRVRSQVQALCLAALAQEASGDAGQALRLMVRALRIGQEKDLCRIFLDEGPRLAALIQALQPKLAERGLRLYAASLLQAFAPEPSLETPAGESGVLIEPLSQQELRVLRLLAAGLSNTEIAGELFVSRNTVKTQVQSIYRKLDVHDRHEARLAARALRLI